MNSTAVPLEILCRSWLDAKRERDEAAGRMAMLAKNIAEALPGSDPEGTTRAEFGDGLSATVTRKMTRTVDSATLSAKWDHLTPTVQAAFRWKADVNLGAMRAIQFANSDAYAVASEFITAKPASPSVDVEIKE